MRLRGSQSTILQFCFNPRTHEGCDTVDAVAPVCGYCFNPRTHEGCDFYLDTPIYVHVAVSIHAPTRGATTEDTKSPRNLCFNPRTHEGCDRKVPAYHPVLKVSIHAPTRGATLYPPVCNKQAYRFNPRTHEGCDRLRSESVRSFACFNPRTHEGCDQHVPTLLGVDGVSIHAPTRGATTGLYLTFSKSCFNPRTHEGCDVNLLLKM